MQAERAGGLRLRRGSTGRMAACDGSSIQTLAPRRECSNT